MNNYNLFAILLMILSMAPTSAAGFGVQNEDGVTIYYEYTSDGTALSVIGSASTSSLNIPSTVTYKNRTRDVVSIYRGAFEYRDDLVSVTIPNTVRYIGDDAFKSCHNLTSITIGNSVVSIGFRAFYYCTSLKTITIPNSVSYLGNTAFHHCTNLTSATLSNSMTSIPDNTFNNCTSLTSVTIPNSVTAIKERAFYECSSLESIIIPNSVTTIGDYAFYKCSSLGLLTPFNFPNSVTTIGENAFQDCTGLSEITIGNGVTEIKIYAFSRCTFLTSVVIPNSTYIHSRAFEKCSEIETIVSLSENPSWIWETAFEDEVFYNSTLFVPVGTKDKYKAKNGWKRFVYIEEGVPSGITHASADKGKGIEVWQTNGTRSVLRDGINIIKYSDGTIKKVLVNKK